ncbi:MAG: AraC family transcriptional regulator ligand-binding domain-containing protein [Halioglobus sp.]|nr:AraC family transcriptional regulator ligand-binding domain-containing protein [Halioglobus sp.]
MPRYMSSQNLRASLELFGLPAQKLMDEAQHLGIDVGSWDDKSDQQISAQDFGRLFIAMVRRSQVAAGVDEESLDAILELSSYRMLFTYMIHAGTLRECLARAASYFTRFAADKKSFSLEASGDTTRWVFNLGAIDAEASPDAADFSMDELRWLPGLPGRMLALYLWHRQASWLTGNYIDLIGVHLDCAAYGSANAYTDTFSAPVYFNADWCGMEFHSRYLDSPLVQTETTLDKMLSTFPAELIEADELASSVSARVRGLIGTDFSRPMPSLEEVAERLITTTTTLHRRLRDEGTSFQKLKDDCRRDAAIQLLRDMQNSGTAVSEYLGFSDPSAFFRAFKKWTGLTPQQFRSRKA